MRRMTILVAMTILLVGIVVPPALGQLSPAGGKVAIAAPDRTEFGTTLPGKPSRRAPDDRRFPAPAGGPIVDVGAAPVVLVGRAGPASSFERRNFIFTDTVFHVEETQRGAVSPTIVVRTEGGSLASGVTQVTENQPQFRTGERSRLFLSHRAGAIYRVVGDFQGKQDSIQRAAETAAAPTCGTGYCTHGAQWALSSMPVPYRVNENTADVTGEAAAVNAGFASWENDAGSRMDWTYAGPTTSTSVAQDGTNVVFWTTGFPSGSNTTAFAHWWFNSSGNLTGFDVEFNDNHKWAIGAVTGTYDIESVAVHEAGHALGLDHVTDPNQVMYPTLNSGTLHRQLGPGDINGVRFLYPSTGGGDTTAPTVQAPTQSIAPNKSLGTSTVPVKLTWSATDPSGIAKYELEQSSNGGTSFTPIAVAATAKTKTVNLAAGASVYQFRVRATDGAGNVSQWIPGPAFKVNPFQESSTAIVYSTGWATGALSGAYGGSVAFASAAGNKATFTIPAGSRNVAWISTKSPARGRAEVWLDGVKSATVDLYGSGTQTRRIVFTKPVSPASAHQLEVRVLGTKNASSTSTRVDLDAFVTLG